MNAVKFSKFQIDCPVLQIILRKTPFKEYEDRSKHILPHLLTGCTLDRCTGRPCDVQRLQASVIAGTNRELNRLALLEAAEALGVDAGLVHEEVVASWKRRINRRILGGGQCWGSRKIRIGISKEPQMLLLK